jgi:spermidine synthase
MYAELTAYRAQRDDQLRAFFIGGGGYTFPKYIEAIYPDADVDVVEIDPGVTEVAHDFLGLKRDTEMMIRHEDARLYLEREPTELYDLIIGDAFNDFSVPYHLTTKEFNDRVRAWLEDDGLYLVNIVDGARGEFLRAYTRTLRETFRHTYLAPTGEGWRRSPRTTFVVIASDAPVNVAAFRSIDAGDSVPLLWERILPQEELDALLAEGDAVTLTDQYAPVDQMLASVFRDEIPD